MEVAWPIRMRRPSAGRVLAVVSVLPALAVAGWLLAGLPLLLLGHYRPLPASLLGAAVIAVLCRVAFRLPRGAVPAGAGPGAVAEASARRGGAALGAGAERAGPVVTASAWQVVAVLAVAVASGVFNGVMHSEQLAVRRDPGTYAQYAIWLAGHGSLPIPTQVAAFGGPDRWLDFQSIGFYFVDGSVQPQFMPGPPMLLAAGDWLGGLFLTPPVLGALAVLVLAGLVARLAGARWAAPAALAFAMCLPILYTSRTTFSEIPSLILLFGGLTLAHDAVHRASRPGSGNASGRGAAWLGALAGLVAGLAVLVRIDGLRDVLPVLAFAGLLIAMRRFDRPQGVVGPPMLAGVMVGAGLGLGAGWVFARTYFSYLSGSLKPLLLICAAVLVLTIAGTIAAPWIRRVRVPGWVPTAGAALVMLIMAGFAVRPWLQTVRRVPVLDDDRRTATFIAGTQKIDHLPVDGTRLYSELSLHWVSWYVGAPVVVLATIAAAVLLRRLLGRSTAARSFAWLLPLAVIGWTTVTTLLRPEITPDHPWASRRLVPVMIPGLILLAVWGLSWLRDQVLRRGYGTRTACWVSAAGLVLILVPPAVTSIGTAFTPIESGERAAVEAMCAKIPPNASVLIAERVTADRFAQVVRGMCDRPTAQVRRVLGDVAAEPDVRHLMDRVRGVGRVPVVLGAEREQVTAYGTPVQVMSLVTPQDERSLVDAPNGTWTLRMDVWMAVG